VAGPDQCVGVKNGRAISGGGPHTSQSLTAQMGGGWIGPSMRSKATARCGNQPRSACSANRRVGAKRWKQNLKRFQCSPITCPLLSLQQQTRTSAVACPFPADRSTPRSPCAKSVSRNGCIGPAMCKATGRSAGRT